MKRIKNVFATLFIFIMACSVMIVPALAVTPPDYAHLEVGSATLPPSLEVGDEVRIPVSLAGLETDAYLSGFHINIGVINDYVEVTDIEFVDPIGTWSGGFNKADMTVDMMNPLFATNPETGILENGKLFDVVCTVIEEIPQGRAAGIQLSGISMSQTSSIFLNSTDGTRANLYTDAVVYPIGPDGEYTGGIFIPESAEFTVTVAATETKVEMDDTFDVTVTVNGDVFVGAEYSLSYESDKFELVSKPNDVIQSGDTFKHVYLNYNAPDGTVIATYTFKALAHETEVTGYFTLNEARVETALSSLEGNSEPCKVSDPAAVVIALKKGELTVSAEDVEKNYDGNAYGVTATANLPGAVVKYRDAEGAYTLDASPTYDEIGEYTVYFRATLKGYEPAYGSAKVIINEPQYVVETNEYVAGYSLVLVYTNSDKVTYSYDGNAMLDVSNAGYTKDGESYSYVYAWVVKGQGNADKIDYLTTGTPNKINYSCDVNASGSVDLRDVSAVVCVYNTDNNYMVASQMALVLRADVNHDKSVTMSDVSQILNDASYNA